MGNTSTAPKTKAFEAKVSVKAVEGERTIVAVVSSSNRDRDDEIVDVRSLRLPLKGGGYVVAGSLTGTEQIDIPLLLNHSFNVDDVIGSVRKSYLNDGGELVCEFGISKRAKAQDLLTLIDEGHLDNAFSITMTDYTYDSDEWKIYDAEVVEISLVFRGSNKDARILQVKSLMQGESMAKAKTLAEKKAELEALTKEIETEEAQAAPETPPEDKPAETPQGGANPEEDGKTNPAPAGEAQPVEQEQPQPQGQQVETPPPQDSKSVKQEPNTVSKEVAIKQVQDAPEQPVVPVAKKEKQLDKFEFTAKQFVAWVNGDSKTLSELNAKAIESHSELKSKATYMNTGVTADGGAIVPNAELLADIYTTLADYSTVAGDLRVVTLSEGNSIDFASLLTDVVMTEVGSEGGNKPVTKPTLAKGNLALREFAGIALITKKLVRQAAVNVYDLLRESFARAIANQRAVLALTDATSGIANVTGTVTVTAAATHTTVDKVTWADIRKMPYALTASVVQGAKYYISRELLAALDSGVDSTGRDLEILTLNGDGLSGRFKNGFEFAVEEVLGKSGAPHAIFGSMSRFGILLRQGTVESETFDTGSVTDGSSVVHNLLQQNKLAQRVAFYENVGFPIPSAFAKLALASS